MKLYEILFESEQPPEPKQADMRDALEMVRESYPEEMENKELEDFDLTYLGKLSVDEIGQYADLSSWMEEFDKDDVEGMKRFRAIVRSGLIVWKILLRAALFHRLLLLRVMVLWILATGIGDGKRKLSRGDGEQRVRGF